MLNFPEHKCGLFLTHNEHRDYYELLETFIKTNELDDSFESEEEMAKAIATDECWVLQWYPRTPIGSHRVAAPTLEDLLRCAAEVEAEIAAEDAEEDVEDEGPQSSVLDTAVASLVVGSD